MSHEVGPKSRIVRIVAAFVLLEALIVSFAAKADPPAPLKQDAVSLTGVPPCDEWRMPNYDVTDTTGNYLGGCWPAGSAASPDTWDYHVVFGEISARLIRSSDSTVPPQIVLLNNNSGSVFAWKAPLSAPWDGDFADDPLDPHTTLTSGYGPYIIDAFSDDTYPGNGEDGDDIVLWHTISVWHGPGSNTPYGVYTGSEVIPWP